MDYGKISKKVKFKEDRKNFYFKRIEENMEKDYFLESEDYEVVHSSHETVISGNEWVQRHMEIEDIFFDKNFDLTNKNKCLYGIHFDREHLKKKL